MGKSGDPEGDVNTTVNTTLSKPKDPKMQAAKVHMPNGTSKDFELHRGSDGDALFTLVSTELSIEERDYFSLCYYDNQGTRHWLYNDKKILRQLKDLPWEFSFEVKFYPTEPATLNDDNARYNLFLQLRKDVASGRLPATIPTHALLGALVAQAEYGDADSSAEYERYLRDSLKVPNFNDQAQLIQLLDRVKEVHREQKGLTASEAESKYLDACKQLSMYGVFVFDAKDKDDSNVGIGICATGVNIYKETIRVHRFVWQNIVKISYRKNTFSVKIKEGELNKKEVTLTYKVHDYIYAKRVWKCGVEHHTFFRLIQPENKPKGGLFRWGSTRFRYRGRTQFQTKMASQMFDHPPGTVPRSTSARLSRSFDHGLNKENVQIHDKFATLGRDGQHSSPVASPGVSYEIASSKRAGSTNGKVSATLDEDELVYTPVESPTSAAYYLSARSSLRSPYSSGAVSPHDWSAWGRDVSWRQHVPSTARRNLFGRGSDYSELNIVRFDDEELPIGATARYAELEHFPIQQSVTLYNPGFYTETPAKPTVRIQQYAPRNGYHAVERLEPVEEMQPHPIRYFVSLHHSGVSERVRISRLRHVGSEDTATPRPENYVFSAPETYDKVLLLRDHDLVPASLLQYCDRYYTEESSSPGARPPYRLITRVNDIKNTRVTPSTSQEPHNKSEIRVTHRNAEQQRSPSAINTKEVHLKTGQKLEEEKHEVRLVARIAPSHEEQPAAEAETGREPTSRILGFLKTSGKKSKSVSRESSTVNSHPSTSDRYEGPPDTVDRRDDLANLPLEHEPRVPYVSKTVVTNSTTSEPEEEIRQFRYIARVRHEGDEETVEKDQIKPELYNLPSTSYEGPLEDTNRHDDLQQLPLPEHAQVYHSGQSWVKVKPSSPVKKHVTKKAVIHLKTAPAEDEEKPEVRLVARTAPSHEPKPSEATEKYQASTSSIFGFLKTSRKKSKSVSRESSTVNSHPSTSDRYEGPLDTVDRRDDLANLPLEHQPCVPYVSKTVVTNITTIEPEVEIRQFRYIARVRHEGDEETVEKDQVKPELYNLPSTSNEGPLEDTNRHDDLQQLPLSEHAQIYQSGQSWDKVKPSSPVKEHVTKKKALIHLRSAPEEAEEKPEVRLVARIAPSHEPKPSEAYEKSQTSSSSIFGFLKTSGKKSKSVSRESNTVNSHPSTSDRYEGPLDTVDRRDDLANLPLEHEPRVPYVSKTVVTNSTTSEPEVEIRQFRYIARVRHVGDEETVEKDQIKPELYGLPSTSYEGPLEDTNRHDDLQQLPLPEHAQIYHSGQSWVEVKPSSPVKKHVTKKAVIHLKTAPAEDEEKPEVRLVARTAPSHEPKPSEATEKYQASTSSIFGFLKTSRKKSKSISRESSTVNSHPSTSDRYEGPLDTVDRRDDLANLPLEHQPCVPYVSKTVVTNITTIEPEVEIRQFRYIARVRHEGDEETVEKDQVKPELYNLPSTSNEGPLEDTNRHDDLQQLPLSEHAQIYQSGQSWDKVKPSSPVKEHVTKKKALIHLRSAPEEAEEKPEVRLVARIAPSHEPKPSEAYEKSQTSSSSIFGFLKTSGKKSKSVSRESNTVNSHPSTSDRYEGPLDTVDRRDDLANLPLEHEPRVPYVSKTVVTNSTTSEPEVEIRQFRYIARVRHVGDEETVEKDQIKPELYGLPSTSYEGPLEDTNRHDDLQQLPLPEHAQIYHSGQSWVEVKPSSPVKKHVTKKAVIHLKTAPAEDEEKPEVRLVARTAPSHEPKPSEATEKYQASTSSIFGFLKTSRKKSKSISRESSTVNSHPSTSDRYEGPLDTVDRRDDLANLPLEHQPPGHYISKTVVTNTTTTEPEVEIRQFRYIARIRHEGDEETVEKDQIKPELYGLPSTSYEGPLEDTNRHDDLQQLPLSEHAQIYQSGQSWDKVKPSSPVNKHVTKKKALIHLRSAPEEAEEKPEVRLVARIAPSHEPKPSEAYEKSQTSSSSIFGFLKTSGKKSKSVSRESSTVNSHPSTSDRYEGPLDTVDRRDDLANLPLEHQPPRHYISKTVVTNTTTTEPEVEIRQFRYIAQVRREGDEETVEKDQVKPELYGLPSTSYEGPLETVDRRDDLANLPLEHQPRIPYVSKTVVTNTTITEPEVEIRQFRYIARVRHEGDEETVEKDQVKPELYNLPSTSYEGPLEDTNRHDDLQQLPLPEHAQVYHSGQSWVKVKPSSPVKEHVTKKKALIHLRSAPEEAEEKPEVRLVARIAPSYEPKPSVAAEKSQASTSSIFGFLKTSRKKSKSVSRESSTVNSYPSTSDRYEGPLDTVDRRDDLANLPLEHQPPRHYISKTVVTNTTTTEPEVEIRQFRYIARVRHEGDEETVEKDQVKPELYNLPSTSYEGPLEDTNRHDDLQQLPLPEHAQVYHSGQSWVKVKPSSPVKEHVTKKKAVIHLKTSPVEVEEKAEVRLVARIAPSYEPKPSVAAEKSQASTSSIFGFLKTSRKKSKSVSRESSTVNSYPSTSDRYEGPLDTVDRRDDLANLPLEHQPPRHYISKTVVTNTTTTEPEVEIRQFRYIARVRHEGDEETVEKDQVKPELYNLPSTSYEGPLEDTNRHDDLQQLPLPEHAQVYHSGQSWVKVKPSSPVKEHVTKKKAVIHLKTSPVEVEEKAEVRLVARIAPSYEPKPSVAAEKSQASTSSIFGFLKTSGKKSKSVSRESSTVNSHPSTSDRYEGPLNTVDRRHDLANLPLEHQPRVPYISKTVVTNITTIEPEGEIRQFRYIARVRHEGDEETVEKDQVKPELYNLPSTSYEGPLEDTNRYDDLQQLPLLEHAQVYHSGQSWVKMKPSSPVKEHVTKKKAVIHLKTSPVEVEEKPEVRLVARIAPSREAEPAAAAEKPQASTSSIFGFLKTSGKKSKPVSRESSTVNSHPSTADRYEGPLDIIDRRDDLANLPLEHQPRVPYISKTVVTNTTTTEPEGEIRQFRYIARVRHEGDEETVEKDQVKPELYNLPSTSYEGPLEDTNRHDDLQQLPLPEHAQVYHSGQTWVKVKPSSPVKEHVTKKKAVIHLKTSPVEVEEKPEVRLVARIAPSREAEPAAAAGKSQASTSSIFGFLKTSGKRSKSVSRESSTVNSHPSTSDRYEGPLDTVDRRHDLANLPLEHQPRVSYISKTVVANTTTTVPEVEIRQFRYIARVRHEGDEETVEKDQVKPELYNLPSTSYEGPLEDTNRHDDLQQLPLPEHAQIYHSGQSWVKVKPSGPVKEHVTKKKAVIHLKTSPVEVEEKPEVRLVARIAPSREAEPAAAAGKSQASTSSIFGFLKTSGKRSKSVSRESSTVNSHPSTSDRYEGPLDTVDRRHDLANLPLEHQPRVSYISKTVVANTTTTVPEVEIRQFRYIARVRHEGDEETVEKDQVKPELYNLPSTSYEGPLDIVDCRDDLANLPLEHQPRVHYVSKTVVTNTTTTVPEVEIRQFRYIARVRHEGDEETVEKDQVKPELYNLPSTSYEGPLEDTNRHDDLQQLPLPEHAQVYHSGQSWVKVKPSSPVKEHVTKKKPVIHLKTSPVEVEEKPDVRLVARIAPSYEPKPSVAAEKSQASTSSIFGFLKTSGKKSKSVSRESSTVNSHPSTADRYEGPLDIIDRRDDLANLPLELQPPGHYISKTVVTNTTTTEPEGEIRQFRYIARVRHEGDEETVEKDQVKPELYNLPSTSYEGPLEDTNRHDDLQQLPLPEHAQIYHSGQSWVKVKPSGPVKEHVTKKKAVIHFRSAPEEVEEKPEVRLVARIAPSYEPKPSVAAEKSQASTSSIFGFLKTSGKKSKSVSRESSTVNSHPSTADRYEGPLDIIDRRDDLANLPLELQPPGHYISKTVVTNTTTTEPEGEIRQFRYIARVRHEGDEETVEKDQVKPELYNLPSTSYEGPLEDTNRHDDLQQLPLPEHAQIYHSGQSWVKVKPSGPVKEHVTKKKAVIHLKTSPVEVEEKPDVRLVARIAPSHEQKPSEVSEKSQASTSSIFGFLKTSGKKSKSVSRESSTVNSHPSTADRYEGPLDIIDRRDDLANLPLELQPPGHYISKTVVTNTTTTEPEGEIRQFRYIARVRHEGDEETVEKDQVKPELYNLPSTSYEGPLEDTNRHDDLQQLPLPEHAQVYHSGQSCVKVKHGSPVEEHVTKKKAVIHFRSAPEEVEEKPEVRLVARIAPSREAEPAAAAGKPQASTSSIFGFLKTSGKKSKPVSRESSTVNSHPSTADRYEVPLDIIDRRDDLANLPLEHQPRVPYISKTVVTNTTTTEPEVEIRQFRYIARVRHEGDEETVEKDQVKPELYNLPSTSYEGPLDTVDRRDDLANLPLEHQPRIPYVSKTVVTNTTTTEPEGEIRQFRYIARVRHEGDEETVEKDQVKPELYNLPSTSYEGPLEDTNRHDDLQQLPLPEHAQVYHSGQSCVKVKHGSPVEEHVTKKKAVIHFRSAPEEVEEKPEVRLVARLAPSHEPKPSEATEKYQASTSSIFGFLKTSGKKSKSVSRESSTVNSHPSTADRYEGPLDIVDRRDDLANLPLEHQPRVPYVSKTVVTNTTIAEPEVEIRQFRYIARVRHEGDEETVEKDQIKPELYGLPSTSYEGPLEDTNRHDDLHQLPLSEHAQIYQSGQSWDKVKPSSPVKEHVTKKKALIHLRSAPEEAEEKPEVRLVARIAPSHEPKPSEATEKSQASTSSIFRLSKKSKQQSLSIEDPGRMSSSAAFHTEGVTADGQQWIEVRVDRRVEVQLEPVFCLTGAGLGAVSQDEAGLIFSSTATASSKMAPAGRSFLSRLGFKGKHKSKKTKGGHEPNSSDSSSSDDEACFKVVETSSATDQGESKLEHKLVRHETKEQSYRLSGLGRTSGFNPEQPSLSTTIAEAERLNQRSPRLEHAERTITVRALAPLPVSFEESGQPHTTVATWQETTVLPDNVTVEYDDQGNRIKRTVKTSQVKHTVQKQSFQNYTVPDETDPSSIVERTYEQLTPLGLSTHSGPIVDTQTRSVIYEANSPSQGGPESLGEFVSSKTVTSGNRTIETITYKTERDGLVETHVEHRVTIHSEVPIDHDAELSAAILEATKLNPEFSVERIEVRQETST